jgi:hypothetical protein
MIIAKETPPTLPPIKVGNTFIPYSTKVRNLGVIMNSDLTWDDQISAVVSGVYFALSRLWLTADVILLLKLGADSLLRSSYLNFSTQMLCTHSPQEEIELG